MIFYIIGNIMKVEAALLLLPLIVEMAYNEHTLLAFLVPMALLFTLGLALSIKPPKKKMFYAREGFLTVALSWVILSVFGALPFYLSGEIPSFVDALFETISGFTTTGASILTDVEALPHSMLFWRSFTHWIGGMGVLVFVLAILPQSNDGNNMHLLRAEVPGPTVGKLVSKMKLTARILYGIYIFMTAAEVVLLCMGGMPLFDSLAHAFGTAGTGGFGIKNTSIAFYDSAFIDGVITVFMILFGVNFNLFYFIVAGHAMRALRSEELRWYLGIIAVSIALITANISHMYGSVLHALRYAAFQVASIITTTGYATADFNAWPVFSQMILVLLMFLGASAGSTGGGLKTARVIVLLKTGWRELRHMFQPRSQVAVRLEGKNVNADTANSIQVFFFVYMLVYAGSVLLLSLYGFDFVTTSTAVAACLNNIGPGLGAVGPTGNFAGFSDLGKCLLSFNMLAGRLEIFPMLMLFVPAVWRNR